MEGRGIQQGCGGCWGHGSSVARATVGDTPYIYNNEKLTGVSASTCEPSFELSPLQRVRRERARGMGQNAASVGLQHLLPFLMWTWPAGPSYRSQVLPTDRVVADWPGEKGLHTRRVLKCAFPYYDGNLIVLS